MKKYELTNEVKELFNGKKLYRIKALKHFGDVKEGDLGGWIEKEENLSQRGDCWVYYNAEIYGNAVVYDNARVSGNAVVYGNVVVFGEAEVFGNARVSGEAIVSGKARVCGNAVVYGNARVFGDAEICDGTDILWISNIGSRNDTITFTRSKNDNILVTVGCFYGTLSEFKDKVKKIHGDNNHAKAYELAIELAKLRINI